MQERIYRIKTYFIKSKIMFQNAFLIDGRIRRTEYGISLIIYAIITLIIRNIAEESTNAKYIFIFYLPALWFVLAQSIKRCQDIGKSGWWLLIPFYVLWLLFKEGDPEENQYGENPKENKTKV
jgi:uncharacterized membrane protein YhaH (DUF805 family)